jgi:hypothetical protein
MKSLPCLANGYPSKKRERAGARVVNRRRRRRSYILQIKSREGERARAPLSAERPRVCTEIPSKLSACPKSAERAEEEERRRCNREGGGASHGLITWASRSRGRRRSGRRRERRVLSFPWGSKGTLECGGRCSHLTSLTAHCSWRLLS